MMRLRVRYLAALESRPWKMGEGANVREGTTHRISIMMEATGETVALKIPQTFHDAATANNLSFGDVLDIVFAPKVVLSVVNDRAVQELKMLPDTFEFVQTAIQSLSSAAD